jgi:histidinol-phosphatase
MATFQKSGLQVAEKPDHTPVTEADRAVELELSQALATEFPQDSLLGEEYGSRGESSRRWIIDPIDGTKNFLRWVPIWATLIALAEGDEVLLGVVSAPALGRRWWAELGQGAWTQVHPELAGAQASVRRIYASKVTNLADSSLAYSSLDGWETRGKLPNFLDLTRSCWRTRGYGDFFSYMLLAEGAVDIATEPELEVYDMAALVPIVTEAGGTFTSLDGQPGPWGGNAVATNGHLHEAALKYLG